MNLATIILATSVDGERFGLLQNFEYQLSGMIIVIVILGCLAFMLHINAKLFFLRPSKLHISDSGRATGSAGSGGSEEAVTTSVIAETAKSAETPEIQAVVAAAVYATLGSSVRIVSVCPTQTARRQIWATEGRRNIFLSRQLKK